MNPSNLEGAKPDNSPSPDERAVLVVDDDATNRLVLTSLLRACGFQTVAAKDGFEALQSVEERKYSAVFVDIRMPGIDGFETIRRMRAMDLPHDPAAARVIGVSASIDKAWQAHAEGFDAFLSKPVRRAELDHVIDNLSL